MNTDQRARSIIEVLEQAPVFGQGGSEALKTLARHARWADHAPGGIVCRRGDSAHDLSIVVRGVLRVSAASEDGREVVFSLVEAGALFGEVALFCQGGRTADATALMASTLLTLPKRDVLVFLAHAPPASHALLELMAERIRRLSEQVVEARFAALPERLGRTLTALARLHPDGVVVASQSELADMVLASREMVNRQLNVWRRKGLLELQRGEVRLSQEWVSRYR
jgi:CRP-like cAMP-binding protein